MKIIGVFSLLFLLFLNGGRQDTAHADIVQEQLFKLGFGMANEKFQAPAFELKNLEGKNIELSSYKGKVVLLNFWATWCKYCVAEMPAMQILYDELKEEGLEIVAINKEESQRLVQYFIDLYKFTFPVLLDDKGHVSANYAATQSLPVTYLIDREGNIIARALGALQWDTVEMNGLFRRILKDGYNFEQINEKVEEAQTR